MYFYQAYGLRLQSELCFPELLAMQDSSADVVIHLGHVDRSRLASTDSGVMRYITADEVSYYWKDVGAFTARKGNEIILDPDPQVEEDLLHLPILGILLALILHQRGYLVLHGSAVALDGQAAVFIAGKGWGKSTLAATLYGRGHHLITDDVVAIKPNPQRSPSIYPSFPQLKLLPEAAVFALGDCPDQLPRLAAGYEKRARRNIERFAEAPLPVGAIYQLTKGQEVAAQPLGLQAALQQLIAHTYFAQGSYQLLHGQPGAIHFQQCMEIIRHVPIYRLERPYHLELVTEIAQLVEEHFQSSRV
ncbi:hypothetical protein [Acaryochloris sp. IP29b_bin.148]|uniref:hypothetical protein n=1 Tax=Acaryochloris sp. IP29b_bin.148 TaxID=2969218 RepID=UPI0026093C26|nr:hypothetical protein [Acaryochloris sp. IP29b_bin.148]